MFSRVVNSALLVLAGLAFAGLGTVAHQSVTENAAALPWGLALALFAVVAFLAGLRLVTGDRGAATAGAIGIVGGIALLSLKSVGGSVLIPDNALGVTWVLAPVLVAAVVIAWPRLGARRLEQPPTA